MLHYLLSRAIALILVTLTSVTLLGACGGSQRASSETPEIAYRKGVAFFDRGSYDRAVEQLQQVFEFGRVNEWADDAQYTLARAYYEGKQYLLAANEFDRFIGLYPRDERVEEAAYYRAMSYYRQSPPFNLDQTDSERAVEYLRLFLSTYPNSERAQDIGQKIDELQEKLARKLLAKAELYERGEMYEAAAITFQRVLEKYPSTDVVDESLLGAMRSWVAFADASIPSRKRERLENAVTAYNRLVQLFPGSPHLKEAELIFGSIQERMETLG
ncbi:MAG TPA: outer membrane protein assembly factor BamD [Rhodothermales bacterium]|nr:outer membrane protein assembly factor BamD [Rhodothermales bacterium]